MATSIEKVFLVGAGTMGVGIAQVAAQAGHSVKLYDAKPGAAASAKSKLVDVFATLHAKGKISSEDASAIAKRITAVENLEAAHDSDIVIEAIVEDLEVKRGLFRALEGIVRSQCVLASNTSSISITAMGNGLEHPARLVGMHFFNPVPLMKLVEVVSGLDTDIFFAELVFGLSTHWGKVAVHAKSTPGFIVNRVARPFYAEALALLQEKACDAHMLDACLKAAGFKIGPCELMDLIGQDTNLAVTTSVYQANYGDKRFAPSLVQRELVDAGRLGRKSGRGFFDYTTTALAESHDSESGDQVTVPTAKHVELHGNGALLRSWISLFANHGIQAERKESSHWTGVAIDGAQLRLTDGRPAGLIAATEHVSDVAVYDLPPCGAGSAVPIAWSAAGVASAAWQAEVPRWLAAAGWLPSQLSDVPGLVVARTISMLINEASDAVLQGVCTESAVDMAMRLGVNYPRGPFEWLAMWDPVRIVAVLDHLAVHYRSERYRVSPSLRERAWIAKAKR